VAHARANLIATDLRSTPASGKAATARRAAAAAAAAMSATRGRSGEGATTSGCGLKRRNAPQDHEVRILLLRVRLILRAAHDVAR